MEKILESEDLKKIKKATNKLLNDNDDSLMSWSNLARGLEIDGHKIQVWGRDLKFDKSLNDVISAIYDAWKMKKGNEATLRALLEALEEAGMTALADKIRQMYGVQKSDDLATAETTVDSAHTTQNRGSRLVQRVTRQEEQPATLTEHKNNQITPPAGDSNSSSESYLSLDYTKKQLKVYGWPALLALVVIAAIWRIGYPISNADGSSSSGGPDHPKLEEL